MSGKHDTTGIDTVQHQEDVDETKRNIGIYLRMRPSSEPSQALSVAEDMRGVQICVHKHTDQGYGTSCWNTHTVLWLSACSHQTHDQQAIYAAALQ